MVARSGGLGAKEGRNQSRGQKRVSEWSEEGESVRQLSLSHPPAGGIPSFSQVQNSLFPSPSLTSIIYACQSLPSP